MRYEELVGRIAEQTGQDPETVKAVLFTLPDALLDLEEGGHVRTPMGVFRRIRRKPRTVKIPATQQDALVPEELIVRLKPGNRLRHRVTE